MLIDPGHLVVRRRNTNDDRPRLVGIVLSRDTGEGHAVVYVMWTGPEVNPFINWESIYALTREDA